MCLPSYIMEEMKYFKNYVSEELNNMKLHSTSGKQRKICIFDFGWTALLRFSSVCWRKLFLSLLQFSLSISPEHLPCCYQKEMPPNISCLSSLHTDTGCLSQAQEKSGFESQQPCHFGKCPACTHCITQEYWYECRQENRSNCVLLVFLGLMREQYIHSLEQEHGG